MANIDMCEHDWPGSGCKECRKKYGWDEPKRRVINDGNKSIRRSHRVEGHNFID